MSAARVLGGLLVLLAASLPFALRAWSPGRLDAVKMVPGMDGRPANLARKAVSSALAHRSLVPVKFSSSGSWPGFRGPEGTGRASLSPPLAESWREGPVRLWSQTLGEGHGAPAVDRGVVYLLDYDEAGSRDLLRAFSLETGEEFWQVGYANPIKRNHGFSRSVPAVTTEAVVSLGPQGRVVAASTADGKPLWDMDLTTLYGAEIPLWYTAQCPLIQDGQVILVPAGPQVLMLGADVITGEVKWTAPNPLGIKMSHASAVRAEILGEVQFLYAGLGGMAGVSPEGQVLWTVSLDMAVVAPSPVFLPPDRIFQTAGYGAGSVMVRVSRSPEGAWSAALQWEKGPREGLACEQQTPVVLEDRMFAVLPKDAGPLREQFVCADLEGNILWGSGEDSRFGLGPWVEGDGKFFILEDLGNLTMAEASASGWRLLDRAKVLEGVDAWGPPALAGNRLLVRDSKTLVCLDVGKEAY